MSYIRIENEGNPWVRGLRFVRPAFIVIQLLRWSGLADCFHR